MPTKAEYWRNPERYREYARKTNKRYKKAITTRQRAKNTARMAAIRKNQHAVRMMTIREQLDALPLEVQRDLLWEHLAAPGNRDRNEPLIVNALTEAGFDVEYNSEGKPDLTASVDGEDTFHIEVKVPWRRPPSQRQVGAFNQLDLPVYVARTVDDIAAIVAGTAEPVNSPDEGDDGLIELAVAVIETAQQLGLFDQRED